MIEILEITERKISVFFQGARLIFDRVDPAKVQYFSQSKGWIAHPNPYNDLCCAIRLQLYARGPSDQSVNHE